MFFVQYMCDACGYDSTMCLHTWLILQCVWYYLRRFRDPCAMLRFWNYVFALRLAVVFVNVCALTLSICNAVLQWALERLNNVFQIIPKKTEWLSNFSGLIITFVKNIKFEPILENMFGYLNFRVVVFHFVLATLFYFLIYNYSKHQVFPNAFKPNHIFFEHD